MQPTEPTRGLFTYLTWSPDLCQHRAKLTTCTLAWALSPNHNTKLDCLSVVGPETMFAMLKVSPIRLASLFRNYIHFIIS